MSKGADYASKVPAPDKLGGGGGYEDETEPDDDDGADEAAEDAACEEFVDSLGLGKDVDHKAVGDALTRYLDTLGYRRG